MDEIHFGEIHNQVGDGVPHYHFMTLNDKTFYYSYYLIMLSSVLKV